MYYHISSASDFFLPQTSFYLNSSPTLLKFMVNVQVAAWPNIIGCKGMDMVCLESFPTFILQILAFCGLYANNQQVQLVSAASVKSSLVWTNPCFVFPVKKYSPFKLKLAFIFIHWLNPLDHMEKRPHRYSHRGKRQTLEDISCDISRIRVLPVPVTLMAIEETDEKKKTRLLYWLYEELSRSVWHLRNHKWLWIVRQWIYLYSSTALQWHCILLARL